MRRRQVQVKLIIPFVGEVSGSWEPDDAEQQAAWELYIELVTRIAVVPLGPGQGLLREALDSLYSLFPTTRDILRRHGPRVAPATGQPRLSVGFLAVAVLNGWLRPLLTVWHPQLTAWETTRPADRSPADHEQAWPHADQLRTELNRVREGLLAYADQLGAIAGVASLLPEPASTKASPTARL